MRKLVTGGICGAMVLCCLMATLAPWGSSAASERAQVPGTWMAGPGCGGSQEWFQHPSEYPYFCDGTAYVEKAQWEDWGAAKATAAATMNEAVLNGHNSVGTAPRRRSAVTVVASHVERCGSRRVYGSIVIRFDNPRKGSPSTLKASTFMRCPK